MFESKLPSHSHEAISMRDWSRLERFLSLGTERGTYVVGDHELSLADAAIVERCLAADGQNTINRIVAANRTGRVPKNDPVIFSLALAAKLGDEPTRRAAYEAVPAVCKSATQLMQFAAFVQMVGGWGRGMRRAVGAWFNARPPAELATQLARYPAHAGWSNRDLLRLAHPRAASPSHDRLYAWAVRGQLPEGALDDEGLALIVAIEAIRRTRDTSTAAELIRDHAVPHECVPPDLLRSPQVWDALLGHMALEAVLRNLPAMTRVGLVAVGSAASREIAARLYDREELAGSNLQPFTLLASLIGYRAGRASRQPPWLPVASVVDAIEAAFYTSMKLVEPTGKRTLLALDISGSMSCGSVAGAPGLTPRIASAATALLMGVTEADHTCVAFTAASGGYGGKWGGGRSEITAVSISPRERLEDVVAELETLPMGGTDCALPMQWAQQHRIDVDTFVVYTDHETWAGDVPPAEALRAYRNARGIPAKLVVVGMTSNGFALADPDDAGMLDVVGFDASTPPVIADFARA